MAGRAVATIDIGTNTLLLLVAREGAAGEVEIVADECRFGRLGKGLDASGRLAPESVAKSLDIAREYARLIAEHGVSSVRAVGTQALREAANAGDFTTEAERILGTKIETIAGEREAELVYLAVSRQFRELAGGDLLVADVGGGSTEFIVGKAGAVESFTSLKIGSVRITERHFATDPPTPAQVKAAFDDIDRALKALSLPSGVPVVATAGTATTLAALDLRLTSYSRDRVHGHRMQPPQVDKLLARLLELSIADKKRLPGMEPDRADVIAGGVAILSRLLATTRARELVVADSGVRWGVLYELLST